MKQLLFCTTLVFSSISYSDLLLTAPPFLEYRHHKSTIEPVTQFLGGLLDSNVAFSSHESWLAYSKDLREDVAEITLSEPHIAAWMAQPRGLDHEILAVASDPLQSLLIVPPDSEETVSSLSRKKICTFPSPSLDAVNVYKLFNNPVFQPQVIEVKGSFQEVLNKLDTKVCDAAVLNEALIPNGKYEVAHRFPPSPGAVFTVSFRQTDDVRSKLKEQLTNPANLELLQSYYLLVFGYRPSSFVVTTFDDLDGQQELLDNVWGW